VKIILGVVFFLFVLYLLMPFPPLPPGEARRVKQWVQLRAMVAGIQRFHEQVGAYPPSDAGDSIGRPYCGAMKLAEALMGRDLKGFHARSLFRSDGLDPNSPKPLYSATASAADLSMRKGPYIPAQDAHAFRLVDIYGKGKTGSFPEDTFVLCDTFTRRRPSGYETGMPILHYRSHPVGNAPPSGDLNSLYDCADNQALIALGVPGIRPKFTR